MKNDNEQTHDNSPKIEREMVLIRKIKLLKELMILTHEQVSHEQSGELQTRQWNEYINQFPEEG